VRPFTIDDALAVPSLRAFAESETSQAVGGMLDALHCAWVNPRRADEAAHQKPYQWQVARDVGLSVPRTLVTSEPEAARRFISEVGLGKTVFKAFLASLEAWRETRLIEQADLDRLDLVRYAPVIFQEYVEGVDLRVTIVGDRMFAAEIDARATSYPVDMRMVISEAEVKPTTLPDHVQGALLALQSRLGLKYGAIDMRRTAEGDCVFLEVNPAGQWLFVERLTGLPISQAVAASSAIPGFFEPYAIDGRDYVDGGVGWSGHADLALEGLLPGTAVAVASRSPLGGPLVVGIGRARIAVARSVASKISVSMDELPDAAVEAAG